MSIPVEAVVESLLMLSRPLFLWAVSRPVTVYWTLDDEDDEMTLLVEKFG